jgi:hypothetical protein
MAKSIHMGYALIILALGSVGCAIVKFPPSEQQVRDLAWQALEPNTSSHDRAAWEVIEIRKVIGRDITMQFTNVNFYGCLEGPTISTNNGIDPSIIYWFVHMEPRRATPLPQQQTVPYTQIPFIPEPFIYKALFLIDSTNGKVVARNFFCVMP